MNMDFLQKNTVTYPALISFSEKEVCAYAPDFDISQTGSNEIDALEKLRKAVREKCIYIIKKGEDIPTASSMSRVHKGNKCGIALFSFELCVQGQTTALGGEK